jgi:hypothetical protein
MGAMEIVAFAACWLFVAVVMLWAVFTENRPSSFDLRISVRDRPRIRRSGPGLGLGRLSRPPAARPLLRPPEAGAAPSPTSSRPDDVEEWITVATIDGANSEAMAEARLVLAAWLAAWGADERRLRPSDVRTELLTGQLDGLTRVQVRSSAVKPSRPRPPR